MFSMLKVNRLNYVRFKKSKRYLPSFLFDSSVSYDVSHLKPICSIGGNI